MSRPPIEFTSTSIDQAGHGLEARILGFEKIWNNDLCAAAFAAD